MRWMATALPLFACTVLTVASVAAGAEYFVTTQGDDDNDGRSREAAFATVQRGVDALDPGDTLTIAPGEYVGPVSRTGLGRTEDNTAPQTVIRAEIPGTVTLRGDVPAPKFRSVDGYQFVYVTDFDGDTEVQAVNELDTLSVMRRLLNPTELEFNPGSFYQDRNADKLYISTSDLKAPDQHAYTVSVTPEHGIYLMEPQRVVIDGLAVTGFDNAVQISHQERTHGATFGIFLTKANDCVIRNCVAWFNGRGIGMNSRDTGGHNVIENCTAWANLGVGGGGALTLFEPQHDEIVHSEAFLNDRFGVLIYIGGEGGRAFRTLSWGNGDDFQLKANNQIVAERSIGVGTWAQDSKSRRAIHSLIGHIRERGEGYRDNLVLSDYPDLDPDAEFADPLNHDYRLQATSRFRGAASDGSELGPFPYEPNIYYVSPEGDDEADGLSLANAWRTLDHALGRLSAGDTLYLEPGRYTAAATLQLPSDAGTEHATRILGRGHEPVIIDGDLRIEGGHNLHLARLNFTEPLTLVGTNGAELNSCRLLGQSTALRAEDVKGLHVEHGEFLAFSEAGVYLRDTSDVFMRGNLFANSGAPAIVTDRTQAIRYSDYNGFANEANILKIAEDAHSLDQLKQDQEAHSTVVGLRWKQVNDLPRVRRDSTLASAGPHRRSIGTYNPVTDYKQNEVRLAGPYVHSVTATTANIEWWTSKRVPISIAWGKPGELGNAQSLDADLAGSFSLTNLEPDTEYTLRITFDEEQLTAQDLPSSAEVDGQSVTIAFQTAASDPAPKVYYVAPDGDNTNTGLSREQAWRTVNHAAAKVRPGDTVMLAGGTYHESVRIRTTGEEGRPITFTSMPGEKVIFDGYDRNLTYFFYLTDKSHINIDGFYFTDLDRGGVTPWPTAHNGAINLYRSHHIDITRCYLDGTGTGAYSPGLLQAIHGSHLLVKNCVIYGTMGGGIGIAGVPETHIENNVFFRNYITHLSEIVNTPDQPIYVRNNIFTDNLPRKSGGSFLNIGRVESVKEDNNVYYVRMPIKDRLLLMFYDKVAFDRAADGYKVDYDPDGDYAVRELRKWTLPEYQEQFNPDGTSFAADPIFAATADMRRVDEDGEPIYLGDQLHGMIRRNDELKHEFHMLFATNPEVTERGIGLQPEVFEDFHFNQNPADQ